MQQPFEIELTLWRKLIVTLKERGRGVRESGAFLLGPLDRHLITEFICYDDLDPDALQDGIIKFDSKGFVPLWKICQEKKLKVHVDVHTHPDQETGQSWVDRNNPMIVQAGHTALIIPHYAQKQGQLLQGVGAYEYLGNKKWKAFSHPNKVIKIKKYGTIGRYLQSIINRFNREK